jgi:hypothetical protein
MKDLNPYLNDHPRNRLSKMRKAGEWAAEKVGCARLIVARKEAGSLGLVLTLEGLIMGVIAKKLMWGSLAGVELSPLDSYNSEQLQRWRNNKLSGLKPNGSRSSARHLQRLFTRCDC